MNIQPLIGGSDFHDVQSIETEVHQLETGTWVRTISVTTPHGVFEFKLFAHGDMNKMPIINIAAD